RALHFAVEVEDALDLGGAVGEALAGGLDEAAHLLRIHAAGGDGRQEAGEEGAKRSGRLVEFCHAMIPCSEVSSRTFILNRPRTDNNPLFWVILTCLLDIIILKRLPKQ